MLNEGVSIIICTYNGALRIEKTLQHLALQAVPNDVSCEIILIDNASTDNTVEVAKLAWVNTTNNKFDFNILFEPTSGVGYARSKGILEAKHDIIIFCDDDNWLDTNYTQNVITIFKARPTIGALGGLGRAQFENPSSKPAWFNKFHHGYAVGQGGKEDIVNSIYGAGMAIRKLVITELMNSQSLYLDGRKQDNLTAGEDGEICCRVRLAGYQILFSPQLTFKHFLPPNRLTWSYLKKLHIGFAKSYLVINLYESVLNNKKLKPFYWLKQTLYFGGIYLKYWPGYYFNITKDDRETKEIHLLTWKNIALTYISYNFKTIKIHNEIRALKDQLNTHEFN